LFCFVLRFADRDAQVQEVMDRMMGEAEDTITRRLASVYNPSAKL
jgi:hypothetical protein